jgi:drug/metabolite transporter (DMT)-like permease
MGKRSSPTTAAFLLASLTGILLLTPWIFVYRDIITYFSRTVWLLVLAAGFFQMTYYASLAGAYRAGDMSIAYPLARSLPVLIVPVISVLLGRGGQVSWQCLGGVILVVAGGVLLPMKHFGDLRIANYLNLSCLLALTAAIGTTGYSMLDDEALRLLRHASGARLFPPWQITVVYYFFEEVSILCWLLPVVAGAKRGRDTFRLVLRTRLGTGVLMGIGICLTYILVLVSMAFVSNVSYVVAFRQISIPIGVMLSVLVLKEPGDLPKFVAVTIMFIGLVLVGTG